MSEEMNWYEYAVGGMWDEMGALQFDYLVSQGLKPAHHLLDVGCGSLRAGVRFIPYLETGHYYGIDISVPILEAAEYVLQKYELTEKKPVLTHMEDFDFTVLDQKFDYGIAQSVFTHIPLNNIIMCLMNMDKVLVPGGRFYATFFVNPDGKHNLKPLVPELSSAVPGPKTFETYFDKDPFHYDMATFEWICQGTGLRVEYLGSWNHPRDQKMMVFIKEG